MSWFLWVCTTGEVSIDGEMQFALDSDLTAEPPQFTLTCISIEGPATILLLTSSRSLDGDTGEGELRRLCCEV